MDDPVRSLDIGLLDDCAVYRSYLRNKERSRFPEFGGTIFSLGGSGAKIIFCHVVTGRKLSVTINLFEKIETEKR